MPKYTALEQDIANMEFISKSKVKRMERKGKNILRVTVETPFWKGKGLGVNVEPLKRYDAVIYTVTYTKLDGSRLIPEQVYVSRKVAKQYDIGTFHDVKPPQKRYVVPFIAMKKIAN